MYVLLPYLQVFHVYKQNSWRERCLCNRSCIRGIRQVAHPESSYHFSSKSSRIFAYMRYSASKYDFEDISTMALYWICMIGVSYFISEYLFNRCLLGTATILSKDEEKTLKRHAKWSVMNPVHFRASKDGHIPGTSTRLFVGPRCHRMLQFVRRFLPRRTTIRVFEVNMSKISAQPGGDNRNTGKDREVFMVLP
jgi:hypothetical protein